MPSQLNLVVVISLAFSRRVHEIDGIPISGVKAITIFDGMFILARLVFVG